MKDKFPGFYPPSQNEFDELLDHAILAVDSNFLLNLYSYSPDTREEVLNLLENLVDRLWLPHQAAYEYHKNRPDRIIKEVRQYDQIKNPPTQVLKALQAR
jgi:hypothetical protein